MDFDKEAREIDKTAEITKRLHSLADSLWTDGESAEANRARQNYSLLHSAAYLIGRQDVFLHHLKTYGSLPILQTNREETGPTPKADK